MRFNGGPHHLGVEIAETSEIVVENLIQIQVLDLDNAASTANEISVATSVDNGLFYPM